MGGKKVIRTGKVGKPAKDSKNKIGYKPCYIFIHRDPESKITILIGFDGTIYEFVCCERPTEREPITPKQKDFFTIKCTSAVYACANCRVNFLYKTVNGNQLFLCIDLAHP